MALRSLLPLLLLGACTVTEQPREQPLSASEMAAALAGTQPQTLPPETDLPPQAAGSWSLACGAALELEPGGALQILEPAGLRALGGQAVGEPALSDDHRRVAWSHAPQARPETVVSVMSCDGDRWGEPRTLVEGPGSPDRVAISPDGAWVVWVSGASGVASLWAAPFEGGDAAQLTNTGVDRASAAPGSPPPGFVPVPHRGPPVIEALPEGGHRATWQAPEGLHSVGLPR
jgi:hypothetical protein